MKKILKNQLQCNGEGIWCSPALKPIEYSDGRDVEAYLQSVYLQAEDLSSNSAELESYIKDWPSQYHLSTLRANLLRQFSFTGIERVLEVGAGCGAITRFLGENFAEVVAVEGSFERARLARLRTRGQDNVMVVCSPFQDLEFEIKFDLIICIGVFEYSPTYVPGKNPFKTFLASLKTSLSDNGALVMAIENQFGLKYFSSSAEDHTGVMFDGIEGYPRKKINVKTFGRGELSSIIGREFSVVDFYYPYPDYKLPSCVLSEEFLNTACPAELIGRCSAKDNRARKKPLFNETFVLVEAAKNGLLTHFSNSFLVVAKIKETKNIELNGAGVVFNNERIEKFRTITHFYKKDPNSFFSRKTIQRGRAEVKEKFLTLCCTNDVWHKGYSLNYYLMRSLYENNDFINFGNLCAGWLNDLTKHGNCIGNRIIVPGIFFDANWSNYIVFDNRGEFIDQEWNVDNDIDLNFLIFKSALNFLDEITINSMSEFLKYQSYKDNLLAILDALEVDLSTIEMDEYCHYMSQVCNIIFGTEVDYYKNIFKKKPDSPKRKFLAFVKRFIHSRL